MLPSLFPESGVYVGHNLIFGIFGCMSPWRGVGPTAVGRHVDRPDAASSPDWSILLEAVPVMNTTYSCLSEERLTWE